LKKIAMDSTVAVNPLVIQRMDSPPPSPPESSCSSSQSEDEDGDQSDDDGLLAGFEFCSKEAIRYLLEEEKLSPDHPVVRNLQLHLLRAATGGNTVADDPPQEN
jgi:hypothetical protein